MWYKFENEARRVVDTKIKICVGGGEGEEREDKQLHHESEGSVKARHPSEW